MKRFFPAPRNGAFFPATLSLLWCLVAVLSWSNAVAQTPVTSDFVVDLGATVSEVSPHIRLSWTQRLQGNITAQRIYRRPKGAGAWVKLATLGLSTTGYVDATAQPGVEYEYWLYRSLNATPTDVMPYIAVGYLSAGVRVPAQEDRGKLLLVIDSTLASSIAGEVAQLESDLASDGWSVVRLYVSRTASPITVKTVIRNAYLADPGRVRMAYLLGHVPVPYSGNNAPDGHGNHFGAWAADGYYADMDGVWTDVSVNNTGAADPRNRNVPGDGKFDPSTFPSALELGVGRVDFAGMTKAPSAAVSEADLLRRYLAKAHAYRYKTGAYAAIPRRTLVLDGLSHLMTGLTGWHWAYSGLGRPAVAPIDVATAGQWFLTSHAGGRNYLIGYASGFSSYESMSGLGTTADFGSKPSRVVFLGMLGSYFGDWDSPNNLMRSVLAGNAAGDSLGLAAVWAGAPNYFFHHMGMGECIGYSVRASQNGPLPGGTTLEPGGPKWSEVRPFGATHTGLMGDPALRLHVVEPPRNLSAGSASGRVTLSWSPSTETDLVGYHVYRGGSPSGPFTRLTAQPLGNPSFSESAVVGQTYVYMVKTLTLETAPGGTYFNFSQGVQKAVTVVSGTSSGVPLTPLLEPFSVAWRIGRNDDPAVVPYSPFAEFSIENALRDPPPGRVTRVSGDPLYVSSSNPSADDDFYCSGTFPVGFNRLGSVLSVPNSEPASAWERALTVSDPTNRIHFILSSRQVDPASRIRLNFEFCAGGVWLGAPLNRLGPGFGVHDIVVRFRSGNGVSTVIYTNRLDRPTSVSLDLSVKSLGATAGANTIEFVRAGPFATATSYWILFDYVSLESAVPRTVSSLVRTATGEPSGGGGVAASASGTPGVGDPRDSVGNLQISAVDGVEYLTLTYLQPEPLPVGTTYHVEASADLKTWSEAGLVSVGSRMEGAFRRITVRDGIPLSGTRSRFLRLRVTDSTGGRRDASLSRD